MLKIFNRPGLLAAWLFMACLLGLALPAQAQVTSLTMSSESGDYIGLGQTLAFAPSDGTFTAQVNFSGGVSIAFSTPTFDRWWYLDFAAPGGVPLVQGTYLNATRFPFNDAGAGLSVSGEGRGCNTLTGSFTVQQIVYGPNNTVAAFEATFEQHCEGQAPALRGTVRYNASVPLYLTAPTRLQVIQNQNVRFLVTATDAQLRHVALSATALPAGATFVDLGNNTGSFSWTPTSSQAGPFVASFRGDNLQGNQFNVSTQIVVIPPPPSNDDFSTPTSMPSLPYSVSENATTATAAPDDPYCNGNAQSVWFTYTPRTNMRLEANTFGSGYDTTLSVYTGQRGALAPLGCNDDAGGTSQSRVRFDATAGTTYYFMASSLFYPVASANLVFNLQAAPPPFSFSPSIAQFASVVPSTGVVTLSGTVQCSEPAYVSLSGQLKQTRGGVAISGYWFASVPCNGVTPWTATVQSQLALFKGRSAALFSGGRANVGATATAFNPETGELRQVNMSPIVTLRGK